MSDIPTYSSGRHKLNLENEQSITKITDDYFTIKDLFDDLQIQQIDNYKVDKQYENELFLVTIYNLPKINFESKFLIEKSIIKLFENYGDIEQIIIKKKDNYIDNVIRIKIAKKIDVERIVYLFDGYTMVKGNILGTILNCRIGF